MSDPKSSPAADPAVQDLIRRMARKLSTKAGFHRREEEDVAQALFAGLLRRLAGIAPDRQHRIGFLARVIAQLCSNLVRERRAAKRDARKVTPLNTLDPVGGGDSLAGGGGPRSPEELIELRADVAAVIEKLPPHLRDLAERLMTDTIAAVARDTGTPPTTLHYRRRQLLAIFESNDLRDYL